jgi:hypothetical protein
MQSQNRRPSAVTSSRRTLAINIAVYVVMNGLFVVGWLPNAGKPLPEGLFWPAVPIVLWGLGIVVYGYSVYRRQPR